MKPVYHESNNVVGTAPKNNTTGVEIHDVKVTEVYDGGIPYMVSFWRPYPEEIEALRIGGAIELWLMGNRLPVMSMGVKIDGITDPYKEEGFQGFNSMANRVLSYMWEQEKALLEMLDTMVGDGEISDYIDPSRVKIVMAWKKMLEDRANDR